MLFQACSVENLKELENKPFNKYPRGYLDLVNKNLRSSALLKTYVHLLEFSITNYKNKYIVIKSACEIGIAVDRHSRSVKRHLRELKALGYIIIRKEEKSGYYRRNYIEVVCPKVILDTILNATKDRNVIKMPKQETKVPFQPQEPVQIESQQNIEALPVAQPMTARFNEEVKRLKESGLTIPKANQQAIQLFNAEERQLLHKELSTTGYLCVTKPSQYSDNSAIHSFNNREVLENVNTRKDMGMDNLSSQHQPNPIPADVASNEARDANVGSSHNVHLSFQQPITRFVTQDERLQATIKLKAMRKAGEIHPNVANRCQSLEMLIQEVIFHCMYRNPLRCQSFKHALNFAAKAIRNGTWTTPKRLVQRQIDQREEEARKWKERDYLGPSRGGAHSPKPIAKFLTNFLKQLTENQGNNHE